MLRITKASDPIEVKTIVACIYAPPGLGKTSLASSAGKVLLLDFDKGSYRAKNRGDVVEVESWQDILGLTAEDLKPYTAIAIDTAGRALDVLSSAIIAENARMGRGGALTLQGYGELKSRFIAFLRYVRTMGLDVILVCHSDEQRNGDETIERLDMQGGSKGEVYKSADVMGRLYLRGGKRVLNFSPSDTAFGKNPAQLPPLEVPDFATEPQWFAGVIAQIKTALNTQNAAQVEAKSALDQWIERINAAVDCADFDALVAETADQPAPLMKVVKPMISKAAKAKGLAFDKAAKAFVETGAAA